MKVDFVLKAYTTGKTDEQPKVSKQAVIAPSSSNNEAGTSGSSSKKVAHSIESDIQNILDVLPHLEVSFIRKLLTRYDNTESAIAAVLEGNLPPDLDETIQVDSPTNDTKPDDGIKKCTDLMEKQNLGDVDREIVKIKTKVIRPKAEKRFLDDKSAIKEFHARNIEHGYIDMPDEYDDEYDDSYDAVVESEAKTMKILKNTGAINELVDEIDDSEESESGDETYAGAAGDHRDKTRDFCENPEAARERWARNREAKYGNKRPPRPAACVYI